MKSLEELNEILEACIEAKTKSDCCYVDPHDCPIGDGECYECSLPPVVEWIMNEDYWMEDNWNDFRGRIKE